MARAPSATTAPLTLTRPAAIHSSISRREPRPAAARTFWTRSAVGAGGLPGLFVDADLELTDFGIAHLLD